jgi:hypothetical protein
MSFPPYPSRIVVSSTKARRGWAGSRARGLCGCGPRCRSASRGRGRTSRRNRRTVAQGHAAEVRAHAHHAPAIRRCFAREIGHRRFSSDASAAPRLGCARPGRQGRKASTARASAISSSVRRRMKTGLPSHTTVICVPVDDRRRPTRRRGSSSLRLHVGGGVHLVPTSGQTAAPLWPASVSATVTLKPAQPRSRSWRAVPRRRRTKQRGRAARRASSCHQNAGRDSRARRPMRSGPWSVAPRDG